MDVEQSILKAISACMKKLFWGYLDGAYDHLWGYCGHKRVLEALMVPLTMNLHTVATL
jgi:hypothetical protein